MGYGSKLGAHPNANLFAFERRNPGAYASLGQSPRERSKGYSDEGVAQAHQRGMIPLWRPAMGNPQYYFAGSSTGSGLRVAVPEFRMPLYQSE